MKNFEIIIDRPIGYKDKFGNVYPINYGYIKGVIGGDGEEQDVYILDIDTPLETYKGDIIAIIHRKDDNETKWVCASQSYTEAEIMEKVYFMEQYFDSSVELIK